MTQKIFEQHIIIRFNKLRLLILVLISLLFIVEGVWLLDLSYMHRAFAPVSLRVIAIIILVVFLLPFCIYGSKLFSSKPAMVIKPEGFVDNTSVIKHKFIHWQTVSGIEIYIQRITDFMRFSYSNKYIQVNLKKPIAYIDTFGVIKRIFLSLNLILYNTPLFITSTGMDIKPMQLYNLLYKQFRLYNSHVAP